LVAAGPATPPFVGVTDTSQVPLPSLMVQERRVTFVEPCFVVTFLQVPLFVAEPLFAVIP
jgi:hypothetical protein